MNASTPTRLGAEHYPPRAQVVGRRPLGLAVCAVARVGAGRACFFSLSPIKKTVAVERVEMWRGRTTTCQRAIEESTCQRSKTDLSKRLGAGATRDHQRRTTTYPRLSPVAPSPHARGRVESAARKPLAYPLRKDTRTTPAPRERATNRKRRTAIANSKRREGTTRDKPQTGGGTTRPLIRSTSPSSRRRCEGEIEELIL